jgi:hypothetical protein
MTENLNTVILSGATPKRKPLPSDMEAFNALSTSNAQALIKLFPVAHLGLRHNPPIGTIPYGHLTTKYATTLAQQFNVRYSPSDLELLEEKIAEWGQVTPAAYSEKGGIIFGASAIPRMQAEGTIAREGLGVTEVDTADINSVARVAVHELIHAGFYALGVKWPFPSIQSLVDGKKTSIKLSQELLVRLMELRQGITEEKDVAYAMPRGAISREHPSGKKASNEEARSLLRHVTIRGILDELDTSARDAIAAKKVDDSIEEHGNIDRAS